MHAWSHRSDRGGRGACMPFLAVSACFATSAANLQAWHEGSSHQMIQSLISGLVCPIRALAVLVGRPSLWSYIVVPIFVNILVGATIYAGLLTLGLSAIDSFVAGLSGLRTAVTVLLRVLLIVGLLLATGFVLVRLGVVLGAPWYTRLSNQ